MNIKKSLEHRVKGWFPKGPNMPDKMNLQYRQVEPFASKPKSNIWKNIAFITGVMAVAVYLYSIVLSKGDVFLFFDFDIRLLFIPVLMSWVIFWLRRQRGLHDWYSGLLLTSAIGMVMGAGLLFWFAILDFIGYWVISIVNVSIFGLLYAWAQETPQQKSLNMKKTLCILLAIAGIIILSTSLTVTGHIEDKLTTLDQYERIFGNSIKLTEGLPDVAASANLTNQDQVIISIIVASKNSAAGRSNLDLTISNQPVGSNQTATVFFHEISINNDFYRRWTAPENGTYYFLLHYNFVAEGFATTYIAKHWVSSELVPTQVYAPLLAQYMLPTLISGIALIVAASLIPILRKLDERGHPKFSAHSSRS
ncbi:MAG: hypothetical protein NWF01_02315 [Candidatus Bathyarchaeota archaeon]|nr:hypothetical protein [Candidatus Bathyarchaeota archaeon]